MHTKMLPTAVTRIIAINKMLSSMDCTDGNCDSSESEADVDVSVDADNAGGMVTVLRPNDGDACVDSSLVTCASEAIVRLVACDPISSKFKCSMQIDK